MTDTGQKTVNHPLIQLLIYPCSLKLQATIHSCIISSTHPLICSLIHPSILASYSSTLSSTHPLIYLLTVLTATLRQSGARTNHLRASMSYSPMKHTPLIPSPSILFRANRVTVRAPGSPQATAWKRRAFFSMASLPHLGTAARNQVIVSMTHHTLPAIVKKYRTMKNKVHTWERMGSIGFDQSCERSQQIINGFVCIRILWTYDQLNSEGNHLISIILEFSFHMLRMFQFTS